MKVVIGGKMLGFLPSFIRGCVYNAIPVSVLTLTLHSSISVAAKVITSRRDSVDKVVKHIGPVIEERRENMELYGKDWAAKPVSLVLGYSAWYADEYWQNDLLQWLLDSPGGHEETIPEIAQRLLSINLASIHTTSMVQFLCLSEIEAHLP